MSMDIVMHILHTREFLRVLTNGVHAGSEYVPGGHVLLDEETIDSFGKGVGL
jgi:hypothetical protein